MRFALVSFHLLSLCLGAQVQTDEPVESVCPSLLLLADIACKLPPISPKNEIAWLSPQSTTRSMCLNACCVLDTSSRTAEGDRLAMRMSEELKVRFQTHFISLIASRDMNTVFVNYCFKKTRFKYRKDLDRSPYHLEIRISMDFDIIDQSALSQRVSMFPLAETLLVRSASRSSCRQKTWPEVKLRSTALFPSHFVCFFEITVVVTDVMMREMEGCSEKIFFFNCPIAYKDRGLLFDFGSILDLIAFVRGAATPSRPLTAHSPVEPGDTQPLVGAQRDDPGQAPDAQMPAKRRPSSPPDSCTQAPKRAK